MDALALLCNLHADGPFTLQRLRRSGCNSLNALLELPAIQLSTHLDGSARTAERFLREAELLSERLEDQDHWEVDETGGERVPETPAPAAAAEVSLEEVLEEDELDEDELEEEAEVEEAYGYDEEEEELGELEEVAGELEEEDKEEQEEEEEEPDDVDLAAEAEMQNVIATWREADRDSPPDDPVDYVVPRPAADQALEELGLEGVDPLLKERLGEAGILSLKGLIDASPLGLARSLALPFTRVKHIQFLARRAWKTRSEPVQAPRNYDELVAVERLDASGPFAGEPGLPGD